MTTRDAKAKYFCCYGESPATGIHISYSRRRGTVTVSGWYDHCVGIEGEELTLDEFLTRIGVTRRDLERLLASSKSVPLIDAADF